MKLVFLVYNAAIEAEVEKLLKECRVESYTKFPTLHGVGRASGPHMGTHIWPAVNSALLIAGEDEMAEKLLEEVRELKGQFARAGIKAFVWSLEEVV